MLKLSRAWHLFPLLATIVMLISCGKQNEGCTDPKASNFDVSADKNCCCKYPKFILEFSFQHDKASYNYGTVSKPADTLEDAGQNSFRVNEIKFMFSDFVFHSLAQSDKYFDKRIKFYLKNNEDSVLSVDDYVNPSFSKTDFEAFTLNSEQTFNSLEFTMGGGDSIGLINTYLLRNTSHSLYPKGNVLWDSLQMHYRAAYISITTLPDSVVRKYYIDVPNSLKFQFNISGIKPKAGFDLNLLLKVNMNHLFNEISWHDDLESVITEKLRTNLPEIFKD